MRTSIPSALLLIIVSTVTFNSCQQAEPQATARVAHGDVQLGGGLHVAISRPADSYLPSEIVDAVSSEIGLHVHEGLLRVDPKTSQVIPGLAKSWSVDEAGTAYVFILRKDAKFHHNDCFGNTSSEITARDFQYSFNQLCGTETGKAFETTFRNRVVGANEFHDGSANEISGITVIDDYKLKIELLKPDPSFLFVLTQPSTAVVSRKAEKECGEGTIIGAGPFELRSSDKDILLVRNPDYYLKDAFDNRLPYIDTLTFKIIATKEKQLNAFFEGKIDLVSGLYLDPVKQIMEEHVAEFSGKDPIYVMSRESESVGYESYSIYRAGIKDLEHNATGYRDFSRVQIKK